MNERMERNLVGVPQIASNCCGDNTHKTSHLVLDEFFPFFVPSQGRESLWLTKDEGDVEEIRGFSLVMQIQGEMDLV